MLPPARPAMLLILAALLAITACAPRLPLDSHSGTTTRESASDQTADGPAVEDEEPVLYDSGYEDDNESCMVCHIDFKTEKISSVHLDAGITCMACHGDSEVHRADEFNIIRPDVIWGRAEIEAFCKQCHEKHKQPQAVEEFREEWMSKRRPNGRWVLEDSVCTDCHGEHAIVGAAGDFR